MIQRHRNRKKIYNPKTDDAFYIAGIIGLAVIAIYFFIYKNMGFDIRKWLTPCLFHQITGYYCPGCGGTRAVAALGSGKILRAFCYHPFVVYAAAIATWFLISQTVERISGKKIKIAMHYSDRYLWIGLAIVILNVIVKNMALFFWHVDLLQP